MGGNIGEGIIVIELVLCGMRGTKFQVVGEVNRGDL